jgi:hypothetical protein
MANRVPFDPHYVARVGAAVYVFAYYEWVVIYLIEQFEPGFVARYCRGGGRPMTSGAVCGKLESLLSDQATSYTMVSRVELEACCARFSSLVEKRNALIHAHPITYSDGSQVLNYQANVNRPLPDMKWPLAEVETALREFDAAACNANELLHRYLSRRDT